MNAPSPTLLVTGASGHLGRRVIAHLLETERVPAARIIATTRRPEALAELSALGVTVRAADFDDPASLQSAFAGADRLLLISTDALMQPGQRLAQHRNAIKAAADAGVKHVLYTSMPEPERSPILFAPDHLGTEQALAASPLDWTVLRNSWYFENLLASVGHVLASGQWFSAAGAGKVAYIGREDIARATAAALASANTGTRTLTLTGGEALDTREVAALLSEVTGKPIEVIDVSIEQLTEGLKSAGLPDALAAVYASFDANTAAGRIARVSDDFRALTGREPERYRDWLQANRDSLTA